VVICADILTNPQFTVSVSTCKRVRVRSPVLDTATFASPTTGLCRCCRSSVTTGAVYCTYDVCGRYLTLALNQPANKQTHSASNRSHGLFSTCCHIPPPPSIHAFHVKTSPTGTVPNL